MTQARLAGSGRGRCTGAAASSPSAAPSRKIVCAARPKLLPPHKPGEQGDEALGGDHQADRRVPRRVGQTLRRVVRIERQIGRARLEHAEDRHQQVGRALEQDGDRGLRSDAATRQPAGEGVGPVAQLPEAHHLAGAAHRRGLRRALGLFLEQVDQGGVAPDLAPGVVPAVDDLALLGRGHQRQLGERARRVGDGAGEQGPERARQASDRLPVEQIGVVVERGDEAVRRPAGGEGDVELGDAQIEGLGGDGQAVGAAGSPWPAPPAGAAQNRFRLRLAEGEGGQVLAVGERRPLVDHHRLEDRRAARVALRSEALDQQRERVVLVGEGAEHVVADPLEQAAEALLGPGRSQSARAAPAG